MVSCIREFSGAAVSVIRADTPMDRASAKAACTLVLAKVKLYYLC